MKFDLWQVCINIHIPECTMPAKTHLLSTWQVSKSLAFSPSSFFQPFLFSLSQLAVCLSLSLKVLWFRNRKRLSSSTLCGGGATPTSLTSSSDNRYPSNGQSGLCGVSLWLILYVPLWQVSLIRNCGLIKGWGRAVGDKEGFRGARLYLELTLKIREIKEKFKAIHGL